MDWCDSSYAFLEFETDIGGFVKGSSMSGAAHMYAVGNNFMRIERKKPLLTIVIPTYNRYRCLKETLQTLLPQITEEVEVIVSNNCSTDETKSFLDTLHDQIQPFHGEVNIGSDRNFFACLSRGSGEYIWTLCDDDLPCSNAVESILGAIHLFSNAPAFYLRVIGGDKTLSNYDASPVKTEWTSFDANGFLTEINAMFTFASSIIVKRSALNLPFISRQIDTSLVPASIIISTVGGHNQAVVSNLPLLFARGDNNGGYDALSVFSKNVIEFFGRCDPSWFSQRSINKAYNDNLALPILIVIKSWPINAKGLATVLRYSYRHSNLYTVVLPALARRLKRRIFNQRLA